MMKVKTAPPPKDSALAALAPSPPSNNHSQKRHEVYLQWATARNPWIKDEAEERSELQRRAESDFKDIQRYLDEKQKASDKEQQLEQQHSEEVLSRFGYNKEQILSSEKEKRTRRLILEERVRRSIVLMYSVEKKEVVLQERIKLYVVAEAMKRETIERDEDAAAMEFAEKFKKTPWKPTLWMLGDCPFVHKEGCPFKGGLCHGLNVPRRHYPQKRKPKEKEGAVSSGGVKRLPGLSPAPASEGEEDDDSEADATLNVAEAGSTFVRTGAGSSLGAVLSPAKDVDALQDSISQLAVPHVF